MSTLLQDNSTVKEAYEKYQQFNSDEMLRDLDEAHQKFLHDQATEIEAARIEAKAEGIEIGLDQGKNEKTVEFVRNMKNEGCDFDFIAKISGLSKDEIEKLG